MTKFEDLTEEMIIEEGLRAIPEYLSRIRPTGEFNLERCVRAEVRRIEGLYRASRFGSSAYHLMAADREEMDVFTAHFIPTLTERTLPAQQRYLQQRKMAQINAITAGAVIPEAFRKVGLAADVLGQKYRAKVVVSFPGHTVRLYVRYKELGREGAMDEVVGAVMDLKDALRRLGYGVVVK